jgi:serine protease AprX
MVRRMSSGLLVTVSVLILFAAITASAQGVGKLDLPVQARAALMTGQSRVIITATDAQSLSSLGTLIKQAGGTAGRVLPIIRAQVAFLPNAAIAGLANSSLVKRISDDRRAAGAMERTGATIGATTVRQQFGYKGSGVGVALIDSGVTAWHDDLANADRTVQRVERFVDFVSSRAMPYDDYGHGSHVAGIVGGNGYDSSGKRSGIAPEASLVVLKVLDATGNGYISDVIAALDYVVSHKSELNIRVVNMSIATGVYESYNTDPLTVATLQVVKANIVVVAAAGNNGRGPTGKMQYGGITAPGNAPWVLTVGAFSHSGTIDWSDDVMAPFSSRGPTAIDATAKPDLVAPGVGIESLSDPDSTLYTSKAKYLLSGTVQTSYKPYLSLSGTSMASPVVAGTVALMLQANPSLTPNAVKAILQYTTRPNAGYDPLTEGAGFLNAKGAVDLARYFANPSSTYPSTSGWSKVVTWGNRLYSGGRLTPDASAWPVTVRWGATTTSSGQTVDFGFTCSTNDCSNATTNHWDIADPARNVVWGGKCGGGDCTGTWYFSAANDGDTVVWGTDGGDTVVWGTTDGDTVVWGTSDTGDTVVWGTSCGDSSCVPVLWNHQ